MRALVHEAVLVHEPDALVGGYLPDPGVRRHRHVQVPGHLEGRLLREVRAGGRHVEGHLEAEHVGAAAREPPGDEVTELRGCRPFPWRRLDVAIGEHEPAGHLGQRVGRRLGVVDRLEVVRPVDRGRHAGVDRLHRAQQVARVDVLRPERLAPLQVVPHEVLGESPVRSVAAHRRLPHVAVGVDHAGQHDAAGGVDFRGALGHLEARADRGDSVARDQDVGAVLDPVRGVHREHRGVAEHERPACQFSGVLRAAAVTRCRRPRCRRGCHLEPPLLGRASIRQGGQPSVSRPHAA